jgi:hypothetical protein
LKYPLLNICITDKVRILCPVKAIGCNYNVVRLKHTWPGASSTGRQVTGDIDGDTDVSEIELELQACYDDDIPAPLFKNPNQELDSPEIEGSKGAKFSGVCSGSTSDST